MENNMTSEFVTELTEESAKDFIKSKKLIIVKGWMDNCKYCDEYLPIYEEVAKEYFSNNIGFGSLKIPSNGPSEFRRNYMKSKPGEPSGAPCTFVFKDGEFVMKHNGRIDATQLKELFLDNKTPAQAKPKQPSDFSIVELKAAWLDQILMIENCQKNIQEIQAELAKRG